MPTHFLTRFAATTLLLAAGGCTTLPPVADKSHGDMVAAATAGKLGETAAKIHSGLEPGESGLLMLPRAEQAMKWRLALVDSAQESIDAQYFIWKDDPAGTLMLEHVLAAADRGVKVRLLVDDMFLSTGGAFDGVDQPLAAINHHPNIEFRLFNPGKFRNGIMGLAGNFGTTLKTYNRRMHNKLMIFDGQFAIVGGRNIGDEYFGLHQSYNFLDLDLLYTGDSLPGTAAAFTTYWNSDLAYPVEALAEADDDSLQSLRDEGQAYIEEHRKVLAAYLPDQHDWADRLAALPAQMHTGAAAFLQDEPVELGTQAFRLYSILNEFGKKGDKEIITSSPYLIPVGSLLQDIESDIAAGVAVKLLTNSMASNDATPAHSHYRKYRDAILDAGAQLFEFHHQPSDRLREKADTAPVRGEFIALHTKAGSVDGEACFIGSLNLDPRSVVVNTENGLYMESEALCGELHVLLEGMLEPENAWAVSRDEQGNLQWSSHQGTVDQQPAQGSGQRIADWFFSILPLESQM